MIHRWHNVPHKTILVSRHLSLKEATTTSEFIGTNIGIALQLRYVVHSEYFHRIPNCIWGCEHGFIGDPCQSIAVQWLLVSRWSDERAKFLYKRCDTSSAMVCRSSWFLLSSSTLHLTIRDSRQSIAVLWLLVTWSNDERETFLPSIRYKHRDCFSSMVCFAFWVLPSSSTLILSED